MKDQFYKMLGIIALAIGLLISSESVLASHGHGGWHGGGGWHHGGVFIGVTPGFYYSYPSYYPPYYYSNCGWVRGHYNYYGYWIPPHRVCW